MNAPQCQAQAPAWEQVDCPFVWECVECVCKRDLGERGRVKYRFSYFDKLTVWTSVDEMTFWKRWF